MPQTPFDKYGSQLTDIHVKIGSVSYLAKEHNVNTASGLVEIREFTYDDLSQLKHSVVKNRITTTEVEGEADAEGNPTTTIKTETSEQDTKETDSGSRRRKEINEDMLNKTAPF